MNVRIIIVTLVSWLLLASCGNEYQVEGNSSVSRLDGKMLFVKVSNGKELIKVDSAEVIHGLFRMEGKIDSTVIASLYMDDQNIMPLVMEKGKIQIKIDNTIVYIGKSTNMLRRIAEHYVAIKTNRDNRSKYYVLAEAKRKGHAINFDVLYDAKAKYYASIGEEIGRKEGEYIR